MCNASKKMYIFFFFQAEDGIRDRDVTGVQTCALPILPAAAAGSSQTSGQTGGSSEASHAREIGRASCRGKSVDLGGRRIIKKNIRFPCLLYKQNCLWIYVAKINKFTFFT